ncbi:unnamed protein product [Caenorhabditis brenneri]
MWRKTLVFYISLLLAIPLAVHQYHDVNNKTKASNPCQQRESFPFFNTPALRILRQINQICIMVALAIVAIFYLLREYATVFHLNFGDEEEVAVTAATEKKPRNTN